MKTRKVLALTVSAAMIASLGLAGCGKSGDSGKSDSKTEAKGDSDSVTLKWVSQGPGEDSWEGLTKPILEEYEKETGVHIDAEFYSFNDLFEVIETKAAAGNADFDVMSVDVTYIAKYGTSGYLEPLDQYFTDEDKANGMMLPTRQESGRILCTQHRKTHPHRNYITIKHYWIRQASRSPKMMRITVLHMSR